MAQQRQMPIEIRWHGRGGQGAVTSADILAAAAIIHNSSNYSQSFPHFGAERRGAPVMAFTRLSKGRIQRHSRIYNPDISVVLDSSLASREDMRSGIKPQGHFIVNSRSPPDLGEDSDIQLWLIDATRIAMDLGLQLAEYVLVNTAMLGAVLKVGGDQFQGMVDMNSLKTAILDTFPGEKGETNFKAAQQAFQETKKTV